MTLQAGLFAGLNAGLKTDILTRWGGARTLADFDYREAATSWVTARTGYGSAFSTHEWTITDTAYSSGYAPNVGTETMVALTGGLTSQKCPGIWTGSSYVDAGAFESTANTHKLTSDAAVAGDFDATAGDFCFRVVFRTPQALPNSEYLISKFSTAGGGGWRVYTSSDNWIFSLTDNSANIASVTGASPTSGADYDDGAIHYITGWVDATAGTIYTKGDLSAETSASIAAIVASTTTTAAMVLNGYDQSATASAEKLQILYGGVCVGANAQAMYDEDFWKHGTDPAVVTALTTASRNSLISVPVSANRLAHFAAGTTPATTQLPIGYSAKLEAGAGGYGLYTNSAMTNLVPYSELSTGATNTNITPTDNAVDSPDGFRSGTTLLATAAAGFQEKVCVTVAATVYTASMYIKESTVGVAGRIVAYDLTGAAEIAAVAFTGTNDHALKELTFTTPAGCISVGLRCEITTDTETVIATAWQLNAGTGRGSYVRTSGAAAALVASDYRGPAVGVPALGEIKYSLVGIAYQPGTVYNYALKGTGGNQNRRHQYQDATTRLRMRIYDGAAASEDLAFDNILTVGELDEIRHVWDESAGGDSTGGYEQVQVHNGTTYPGQASPWEGATGTGAIPDELSIGSSAGTLQRDGVFARIRLYDGLSEALP